MTRRKTFFQELGLATVLLLGFGVVIGMVMGWSISILDAITAKPRIYQDISVMHDGTPVIRQLSISQDYHPTYLTLDGKEITVKRDERFLDRAYLNGSSDIMKQKGFPKNQNRIAAFSDQNDPPNYWYFVHDGYPDGKGYFVGFDTMSKQCIGYIGIHGSCSNLPPQEEWFPMDGRKMQASVGFSTNSLNPINWAYSEDMEFPFWKIIMISGDQLLEVDLRTGGVRTIIKSSDLISVCMLISANNYDPDHNRWKQNVVVRTSDRIIVLDSAGKQTASYVIPKDVQQASFNFYQIDKEKVLIAQPRFYPNFNHGELLTWINLDGKILDRKEVELIGIGRHPMTKSENWMVALVVPAPIAIVVGALALGPMSYIEILGQTKYTDALGYSLMNIWQPFIAAIILATVLAWLCYRRQRRMALPYAWFWAGFVFIFGLPGFFAYRFHRRWPVLDNCHVCGHAVPHDREKCSSCGSEFPLPAPKGIEVFA
jgi:hypothetical protein